MAEHWTVGKKVGAGFLVAGITLLLIAVMGYRSADALIDNDAWVNHTHHVRTELADLLSQLKDAETGQRGFIITGDESFLEPYNAAIASVRSTLSNVRSLTQDNAEQQRRLTRIAALIDAKLDELQARIEQRRSAGLESTARTIAEGKGKQVMDALRSAARDADAEELRLLEDRRARAASAAELTKQTVLWGSVLGAALVALIGWLIVRSLSRQIGEAVRHVQASSTELHTAANQHVSGTKEQVTAMHQVTTTLNELLSTSRRIAESAEHVALIARQTADAARSGDGTVSVGHQAMGAMASQVERIVQQMLELGRKSQQIGGVLEVVAELAQQTNIVAINATIEASVAGVAGARFGIVADEIRKLADRVAGSAKEIRVLIEDVRASVNTTIMTTETGSKTVEAGVRQFAEIAESYQRISAQVGTTTELAKEIELSTKQQAIAVEQINAAMADVLQASRESEVSASQTLQTSSLLATLSFDMQRLVQSQDGARS